MGNMRMVGNACRVGARAGPRGRVPGGVRADYGEASQLGVRVLRGEYSGGVRAGGKCLRSYDALRHAWREPWEC